MTGIDWNIFILMFIIAWLVGSIAVGVVARHCRMRFVSWLGLSLIASPLLAAILLVAAAIAYRGKFTVGLQPKAEISSQHKESPWIYGKQRL